MSGLSFSGLRLLCRNCHVYRAKKLPKNQYFVGNVFSARNLTVGDARDPAPLFFSPEVQKLLRKLNRVDMKKVYRPKKDGQQLDAPEYKFMTTAELNAMIAEAERKAEERLQIPPMVKVREEIDEELSRDPALKGLHDSKFVFTDITYGVADKDRLIVVRDTDGTLRRATWDERFRMNQLYFPTPGRHMKTPLMFQEEHLKGVLERGEYEFVLDRACAQFEPDDPQYQAITSAVYDHVEKERKFESLVSTRHYGALLFYLAWIRNIDNLLLHSLEEDRLADAVDVIRLFHILNPEAKSAGVKYDGEPIPFIQAFIAQDATKKSALELAVQTNQELARQRQEVEEGVRHAHGLS